MTDTDSVVIKSKQVNVKKLHPDAIIPTKGHDTDAGWDLYAVDLPTYYGLSNNDENILVTIPTGVAVEIPKNHVGLVWGRSGMAIGGTAILGGVIDEGYLGEIRVALNIPFWLYKTLKPGDRIAQLLIQKIPKTELVEVDEFENENTQRGSNGFGSTGS